MAPTDELVTFGVEEEFLLLDPRHGRPVPAAPALLDKLRDHAGPRAELMRYQVETATAVCTDAAGLLAELTRLRRLVIAGTRSLGCSVVASGTAPFGAPGLSALTDVPRYHGLALRHPALTAVSGVCGCHVHVGVPSRDLGVQVLARIRPWLATLLAISANSPVADGRDTGWASHRYGLATRWPTARPPGVWRNAAEYDHVVREFLARGAAMDERCVYLLARLSPVYPTVEVRVADVCPDAATALLVAVLVRGLVATALAQVRAGVPPLPSPRPWITTGLLAAARYGLDGPGVDPFTGRGVPAWQLVAALMDHAGKALADLGDTATAHDLLHRVRVLGTGAEQQRRLWAGTATAAGMVSGLTAMTGAG
ncbi:glutamate--cysteine ligase [Actinoplanes sp. NPDC020271]|uniref:glutamate--cysteine ligase n=1 Tax=Actinoplanes sp. NPDC020271 TaxID=3363896 RepID=UPI003798D1D2